MKQEDWRDNGQTTLIGELQAVPESRQEYYKQFIFYSN